MKATVTLAMAMATALFTLAGCGSAEDVDTNAASAPAATVLTSDAIEVTGDTGLYTYGDGGAKTQIRFPVTTQRADPVLYHDVRRLGESDGVVVVLDSYGSRNGGERCANGRESWVRLFSIAKKRMTDAVLAESCLDRREAGEPPVTWEGNGFTVNARESRRFVIVNGKAKSTEAPR